MANLNRNKKAVQPKKFTLVSVKIFLKKYANLDFAWSLLNDPAQLSIVAFFILLVEFVLNIYVIQRVNYTEIDWKAYMQECEGFLNGTWDYSKLKGDTGPLVYPAGFVYIYSGLYFLTSNGENIRLAQYIFLVIYLLQLFFVLKIYDKTRKVPPYALIITILTSYRVHSIFVLRLFNDTISVLLLYISLYLYLQSKWSLGSIFYSLAVSVKMNILLYSPPLLLTFLANLGLVGTIKQLTICALIQLVLGAPFLYSNWVGYIKGSFDLQRIFEHRWTVNYRFLPVEIFTSRQFHISLLVLHLFLLAIFLYKSRKYFTSYANLKEIEAQMKPQIAAENARLRKEKSKEPSLTEDESKFLESFEKMLEKSSTNKTTKKNKEKTPYYINFDLSSRLFVLPMFMANFIGVACARSLHYQFYVWYFHSLPYLLFFTGYKKSMIFLILALIELAWNTYPSTDYSSGILHVCHLVILWGIFKKL